MNNIVLDGTATFLQTCMGGYRFGDNLRIEYRRDGKELMIRLPLEAMHLGSEFTLHFKWADHTGKNETIEDFYKFGDAAPYGRFDFIYKAE